MTATYDTKLEADVLDLMEYFKGKGISEIDACTIMGVTASLIIDDDEMAASYIRTFQGARERVKRGPAN